MKGQIKRRVCLALALSCVVCTSFGPSAKESSNVKAIAAYQEFLEQEDLYALTATDAYPRGDSHAVYAYGDCDGDGLPELHLRGGKEYRVYTYRDGGVVPMYSFKSWEHPYVLALKDGSFAGCGRTEYGLSDSFDASYHSVRRIPPEDYPFPDMEWDRASTEYYFYEKLDSQGRSIDDESHHFSMTFHNHRYSDRTVYHADGEICEKEEWEERSASYRNMLTDTSLQLAWEPLFPEDEWDWLDAMEEGNGVSEPMCGPDEWGFYEGILSGDFSFIEDLSSRCHLVDQYLRSLNRESGRSRWKYILLDFSGDGVKDLFIRYEPDEGDYTSADFSNGTAGGVAYFSYRKEGPDWWEMDITHETYLPLKNGQMMLWSCYWPTTWMTIGNMLPERNLIPEKEYHKFTVDYDTRDKEYYENLSASHRAYQEGDYYSFTSYGSQGEYESSKELTEEEWRRAEAQLKELLIPDSQWEPASVFMPNRYQEEFFQG